MKTVLSFVLLFRFSWTRTEVSWPYGTYGLPKARSGCPTSDGVAWSEGWRRQDMEDTKEHLSSISSGSHMEAKIFFNDRKDINRTFCMKTDPGSARKVWDKGLYCVYKERTYPCPAGMSEGYVKWRDETYKNKNSKGGSLPDGEFGETTLFRYCCQKQGDWFNPIELPVSRPFYLLTHNSGSSPKCQLVKWALSSLEHIVFDTNDQYNDDEFFGDHVFVETKGLLTMFYCYYEGCRYKMTDRRGYFASQKSYSPGGVYPQFQYCSWLITVSETYVTSLNFTTLLFLDCNEHFLRIYDGQNETARLLVTYCGPGTTSGSLLSSSNNLYVVLNSGSYSMGTRQSSGFVAQYSAQLNPSGCRYNLTGREGLLHSPVHAVPDGYPHFQYCSWLVTVNSDFVAELNFTYFSGLDCSENFVTIHNGPNNTAPVLATLCDRNISSFGRSVIRSSTNHLYLVLKSGRLSNDRRLRPRFTAQYSAVPKPTETRATMQSPSEPDDKLANKSSNGGVSVVYIITPIVGTIILLLAIVAVIFFKRRKKQQTVPQSGVFRGANPSYDLRKIVTVTNQPDSECYATPSKPEEKLWVSGGSTVCKEGRNPIYQPADDDQDPSTLYSSTDNITYEPLIEGQAESKNPLYKASEVHVPPVYTEPTI